MADKEFKLPPLSPLIGGTLNTFNKIIEGMDVEKSYRKRIFYTRLLINILSPFRWYEDRLDQSLKSTKLNDPVFILGHWRSGTTHLHNLMCQDPGASYVTTYHTVFTNFLHSQGLLKPFMRVIMPNKRPSDNVKLDPNFPQEEEFALSNMTELAFYHFFYFPSMTNDLYESTVRLSDDAKREQFRNVYHKLLLKAQRNTGNGRLVIKNPVNTGRLRFYADAYPGAKFINIHRNPFIVFLSTKKFFKELFPTLWFESITDEQLDEMILDLYIRFNSDYLQQAENFDQRRLYEISFSDFEQDPILHLGEIYQYLDIDGFKKAKPYFDRYLESLGKYRKNRYTISRKLADRIESQWSPIYRQWGYDFPDNLEII